MKFRRPWLVTVVIAALPPLVALTVYLVVARLPARREVIAPPPPEAPPDLEKLRTVFAVGVDALQRGDAATTIKQLSSFNFGSRAVEEYRLYYLGSGYQLAGNRRSARATLGALWQRTPRLVYWEDVGLNLGGMYNSIADWEHAGDVYREIARRSEQSAVTATARWQLINSRIADGDVGAIFHAARDMVIKNPRAPQTADAIAIVRSLNAQGMNEALEFTAAERLERAVSFLRDGDSQNALDELEALEAGGVPSELRLPVQLNRGLALNHLRRFEESNKALEPLASGPFKIAIPAIYHASKNYRVLASSINPMVNKTTVVRRRVGTTGVHAKAKKKSVLEPQYANVKKIVQVVDRVKKAKKETYARLAAERMKDLLALPLADEVRIEVLNTLIATAETANNDDYEQTLIAELAKLDPSQEAGLQHFWVKAWEAYTSGNLNGATELLLFIRDTYRNPNVKRQAEYWRARAVERLGKKEEAEAIYRSLASAPYADLYVVYAHARGAPHQDPPINPLKVNRPDWQEIAEESMPRELRLAYELTALSDFRGARLEIQKNLRRSNQPYADALLADLYNSSGNGLLVMRSLRRAFPHIATVEQDSVPAYFLRMYYPLKYQDAILKYSRQNGLDPYLVMALIHQESFFNPKARSPVGATGLMQLMPPTAKQLARRLRSSSDVENPEVNIRLGTFHFRQLIDLFGGAVHLAVASYNAGQGNVMRWRRATPKKPLDEFIESIPFPETRNYVKRVTMLAASYRRITR